MHHIHVQRTIRKFSLYLILVKLHVEHLLLLYMLEHETLLFHLLSIQSICDFSNDLISCWISSRSMCTWRCWITWLCAFRLIWIERSLILHKSLLNLRHSPLSVFYTYGSSFIAAAFLLHNLLVILLKSLTKAFYISFLFFHAIVFSREYLIHSPLINI